VSYCKSLHPTIFSVHLYACTHKSDHFSSIHVYPHKLCEHHSESSREQVLLAQTAEVKPYSPPCANKNLCNRPRTCFVCTNAEYQVASNGYGTCMRACMHVCLCVCGRGGRGGVRAGQGWMWVWVLVWTWRSMCACILCVHMHIIICTYLCALFIHVSSFSGLHVLDTYECKQVRGHFLQKSPYNQWLFCQKWPATKGILWVFATLYLIHMKANKWPNKSGADPWRSTMESWAEDTLCISFPEKLQRSVCILWRKILFENSKGSLYSPKKITFCIIFGMVPWKTILSVFYESEYFRYDSLRIFSEREYFLYYSLYENTLCIILCINLCKQTKRARCTSKREYSFELFCVTTHGGDQTYNIWISRFV